ncbi:MAG: hypothetical protein ACYCU0_12780 [Solirubrobacteraceae bacterium]
MSRIAITLDEHALAELRKRAVVNSEPASRTAARLIRDGLLTGHDNDPPPIDIAPPATTERATGTPAWLEPLSERERWRREIWAAVSALHVRYPRALSQLRANWWQDRALTETLAALAAWRAQLDAGRHTDPRAELLFHDRLTILERDLARSAEPMTQRFKSESPPEDWITTSQS